MDKRQELVREREHLIGEAHKRQKMINEQRKLLQVERARIQEITATIAEMDKNQ